MSHDDVTVLIVCNGPGAKIDWRLPLIIQELKRSLGMSLDDDNGIADADAGKGGKGDKGDGERPKKKIKSER